MLSNLKVKLLIGVLSPLLRVLGIYIPPVPGVCGIIARKGKILVISSNYQKGYTLPGGGVQPNDKSLEDALKREIKEETGLEVKSMSYKESIVVNKKNYSKITCFYEVITNKPKRLQVSEEGRPLWISYRRAYKKMVYTDCKKFLKHYLQA